MATATLLSLDEFAALPDTEGKQELDCGALVTMAPVQFRHTRIQHILLDALRAFVRERGLGEAFLEPGVLLADDPPTLRAPDVAFFSRDLLVREPAEGFFPGAPTIAFEVVSPSESAKGLETKVRQYLVAGSEAVVSIYPDSRTVWVHRPDGTSRRLEGEAELTFPDILGDWSLPLPAIFPTQAEN
jgi:Uma2 family endonuclease